MAGRFVEPKVLLANERTYIKWTHMAVTLGSIAAGLLSAANGHAAAESANGGVVSKATEVSRLIGLILLPVAIVFAIYACYVFRWRDNKIRTFDYAEIAPEGVPFMLGGVICAALVAVLMVDVTVGGSLKIK